jgi:hypothetical protein
MLSTLDPGGTGKGRALCIVASLKSCTASSRMVFGETHPARRSMLDAMASHAWRGVFTVNRMRVVGVLHGQDTLHLPPIIEGKREHKEAMQDLGTKKVYNFTR